MAWLFGVNVVVAVAVNLAMTPINLSTILPFIWFGSYLTGTPSVELSVEVLVDGLKNDFRTTAHRYGGQVMQGILGWFVVAPFMTMLFWAIMQPLAAYLIRMSIPLRPGLTDGLGPGAPAAVEEVPLVSFSGGGHTRRRSEDRSIHVGGMAC